LETAVQSIGRGNWSEREGAAVKRAIVVVSGALVLVVMAISAAIAGPATKAESEPNGTSATATFLNPSGCYTTGSASINPGGDFDFWSFPAEAGNLAWMSMDTGGTQNAGATSRDTVIDLFDTDGVTLIENDDDDGTGNGGDGTIETGLASQILGRQLPSSGIDFLRVRAFSGTGIIDPYRVFLASTSEPPTREVEPNDSIETANPVPNCRVPIAGAIDVAGDSDFYSLFLRSGETVYFPADADPERDGEGTDLSCRCGTPVAPRCSASTAASKAA
jgi:hypothetical protein